MFSGAFLDIPAAMFKLQNAAPAADDLLKTTQDAAKILVNAILAAHVVPDYYTQVAAHMVTSSQIALFDAKYASSIKSAFLRRADKTADTAKDRTPDPHAGAFQNGVEIRQEVADLNPDGTLPLGANFVRTTKEDGPSGIKRFRVNF